MENNFTLPTNWKVRITEANREVLEQWRIKQPGVNFYNEITCLVDNSLNYWLISDRYDGSYLHWGEGSDYKEITYEQFKQFILMENNFTPIAMKCNEGQFNAIRPILEEHGMKIVNIQSFKVYPYLINNTDGAEGEITNVLDYRKNKCNRTSYEQWNQDTFLKACGIETNQNTEMKTYNIKISDLKKIHDVACDTWKSKIKALIVDPFADYIILTQQQVDEMFNAALNGQRPVLVEVFGEPVSQCPYKEGQLLWVWDFESKFPAVRKFLGMDGSKFKAHLSNGHGTTTWDCASPFNNGQFPDQFKHLLENQ